MEGGDEESVTGPARPLDTDPETEQPDPAAAPAAIAPYPGDIDDETDADLARLLDPDSEQPDPAALRSGMAPYLGDIDRYMRSLELEESRRPRDDYIWTTQEDINPKMRAVLVDWLVEVACTFRLPADTLHLAVSYVDRFLTTNVITRHDLQLLGVTALLVAAKYEEDIFVHEVQRHKDVTANTYTRQQVVKMETDILKSLNFEMGSPTARTFLWFTISPTARPWNLTLQRNTKYKVSDLKSCILMIHELQLNGTYPGMQEDAIKVKYSHHELEGVSAMASPENIPPRFLKDIRR